uniref:BMA-COQ-6, isoform b n=1 Tax=Brugia malayi TaxID=6279 RepID=A0A1I9G3L5_BRUMA|nr:BMA-COQ-6, isoform b [Brugia malayi]
MISRIFPLTRCSYSSTTSAIGSFYDIIIIGGGMVGNAMACSLGYCSQSSIRFAQPDPTNEVAYMIENHAIVGFLSNRIKASCPNVTVRTKAKIGADGARSMVRDMLNFQYTSWGYGQSAVVANLQVEAVSFPINLFTPSGPVALLPLTENMSSVTWSTSAEHAEELLSLPPEKFVDELNEFLTTDIHQDSVTNQFLSLTEQILKGVFSVSEKPRLTFPTVISLYEGTRAGFPLAFGHSYSYVIPRAALIGDAAHRTHPLAGQGVNLGWSDVKILLECLQQCVVEGADLGSLTYLSDYDTQAQRRNVPVQVACDWLNRLYLTTTLYILRKKLLIFCCHFIMSFAHLFVILSVYLLLLIN